MNNLNNKKLDLLKRSNNLLEKTKNNYKIYEKERKLLLEFTKNPKADYDCWEHLLNDLENIFNLDNNLKLKETDLNFLKSLAMLLREQEIRHNDTNSKNVLFKIIDKNNNSHLFLIRKNAKKYIENNKDMFTDTNIIILDNNIEELNYLLDLIARNF